MKRTGEKEDFKDNPFSFRTFLTNPSSIQPQFSEAAQHQQRCRAREEHESNQSSTNITASNHMRDTDVFVPSHSTVNGGERETNNPYSFKRFLQQADSVRLVQVRGDDNCMIIQGELPDFVQDHFSSGATAGISSASVSAASGVSGNLASGPGGTSVELPDFALSLDENSATNQWHMGMVSGARSTRTPRDSHDSSFSSGSNEVEEQQETEESRTVTAVGATGGVGIVLPDFLSDSGVSLATVNGHHPVASVGAASAGAAAAAVLLEPHPLIPGADADGPVQAVQFDLTTESELQQLRREKTQLEQDLTEKQRLLTDRDAHLDRLRRQMREREAKEAEETATMDTMMKQVEANLLAATERACRAEKRVTKLTEEVRMLKSQLASAGVTGGMQAAASDSATTVHVRQMGAELGRASREAEQMIKNLLKSVGKAKVVAEHLQSLDKFSEPCPPPTSQTSPTSSPADPGV